MKLKTCLLAAALSAALITSPAFATQLTVTGSAGITAAADNATVTVCVETVDDTVSGATSMNAAQSETLRTALEAAGVTEITTESYYVEPRYDYSGETMRIVGYSVSNTLNVKVEDVAGLGTVLDAASGAGATHIYGITFGSSNAAQAQDEAARLAVADALRKAELYADAAGMQVTEIISIEEGSVLNNEYRVYGKMAEEAVADTEYIANALYFTASVTVVAEIG